MILQAVEAYRQALVLQAKSRATWTFAGIGLLFAAGFGVLAVRASSEVRGDVFYPLVVYVVVFQLGLPLVATWSGVRGVHDELADKTAVWLFVRPLPRFWLILGRWAAATTVTLIGTACVCVAAWVAVRAPGHVWRLNRPPEAAQLGTFLQAAVLGAPAYAAVGALCGAWVRRPLVAAVLFVVVWEGIVSNLPPRAGVRGFTVADPVRRFLAERLDPAPQSPLHEWLVESLEGFAFEDFADPVRSVVWFTVIVLGAAVALYSRREYEAWLRD